MHAVTTKIQSPKNVNGQISGRPLEKLLVIEGASDLPRTLSFVLHELGDISASRVLMDPAPGTATESDLLNYIEGAGREKLVVELCKGILLVKPMGYEESILAGELFAMLHAYVRPRRLGWLAVADGPMRMKGLNVRVPDISFIARRSATDKLPKEAIASRPPDLVVEILSESNTAREMTLKRGEYFASGTRMIWEIDPRKKKAKIYTSASSSVEIGSRGMLDASPVIDGFSVRLGELFAAAAD